MVAGKEEQAKKSSVRLMGSDCFVQDSYPI
jgi:hypothetical protein